MANPRRIAERVLLGLMGTSGIAVALADQLDWLDGAADVLPKITLVILSTVTLFLLLEIDRLKVVDQIHDQVSELSATVREQLSEKYAGVSRVHDGFSEKPFIAYLRSARREVAILQTWIPNIDNFQDALLEAVKERHIQVRVLLLFPGSPVAGLRDEALLTGSAKPLDEKVKEGVERCLNIFATMHAQLGRDDADRLQVRVYNSLPSVAVYKVDGHYFVSSFLHSKLAIECAQIEVDGADTAMATEVQAELDTIWQIGRDIDLRDWKASVDNICW